MYGLRFFAGSEFGEIIDANKAYKDNNGPYMSVLNSIIDRNSILPRYGMILFILLVNALI